MFARFREWRNRQREWLADHKAAWAPATTPGPDRLTPFQHQCREELLKVTPLTFEPGGEKENYLVANLPNRAAKVYIYENGSNIHELNHDFVAEEWDYRTPDDLIAAVANELRSRVAI